MSSHDHTPLARTITGTVVSNKMKDSIVVFHFIADNSM